MTKPIIATTFSGLYIKSTPWKKAHILWFQQASKKLKSKYEIALITTNTAEAINRILKIINLEDLFDIIEASNPDEKDDKTIVFDRFIRIYGKPILYIGGDRKDSFDYCKQHSIRAVFANLEDKEDMSGVESAHNLKEIELKLR